MPKWAQDCFYQTVVLGLKPLLLQDNSPSSIKHCSSTSSVKSSDSLETTSEFKSSPKEIQLQQRRSVSDYKEIESKIVNEKYEDKNMKLIFILTSIHRLYFIAILFQTIIECQ